MTPRRRGRTCPPAPVPRAGPTRPVSCATTSPPPSGTSSSAVRLATSARDDCGPACWRVSSSPSSSVVPLQGADGGAGEHHRLVADRGDARPPGRRRARPAASRAAHRRPGRSGSPHRPRGPPRAPHRCARRRPPRPRRARRPGCPWRSAATSSPAIGRTHALPSRVDDRDHSRRHRHVRARHGDLRRERDGGGVDDRDRARLDEQHVAGVLQHVERAPRRGQPAVELLDLGVVPAELAACSSR